ncbi:MAG TPA: DUF4296 domain-containing protein [Hymenobacter sp.]|nr:DUF4296 domain-containing protein [Hymenobacter sp.]HLL96750.1 DUF4296 domain-containing protein [Spirosoma sp.]
MRRKLFLTCLRSLLPMIGLLAACTDLDDKQPDNLIPESQMAAVLTEIHLAEARVSRLGLGSMDSSNMVYKRLERQIFQKFKVDTSAYSKSYVYYSSHPLQMEAIYKQITENLKKKVDAQEKQLHAKKTTRP